MQPRRSDRNSPGPHEAREPSASSRRPSPAVREVVARSWERSARSGAGTDAGCLPGIRLAPNVLAGYRAEHPLAPLLPVVRDLLGWDAREEQFIFAVGDAKGTLLWVEGAGSVLTAAERMNFVAGAAWNEAEIGTNAPGTALALGTPVRIAGAEHYNSAVRPWSCCAAPIHGPDGQVLGVVDLTGDERMASPRALALCRAAARAVEAELARRAATADAAAFRTCLALLDGPARQPAALLTAGGDVQYATRIDPAQLAGLRPTPGVLPLPDGRMLTVEAIGSHGHMLIRCAAATGSDAMPGALRLSCLARDHAVLEYDGRTHRLSRRHSEVLLALHLLGAGVSGDRLAVALSDTEVPAATLRVEMSRLRALLGPTVLGSKPYRLLRPIRSDLAEVRDLLAAGRAGEALDRYSGPLLPWSDAPVVAAAREELDQQLRVTVLASRDAQLMRRWVDAPWGAQDARAWRALADNLPGGSVQRAAAAERARALLVRPPV
jgi:hypothetical protein